MPQLFKHALNKLGVINNTKQISLYEVIKQKTRYALNSRPGLCPWSRVTVKSYRTRAGDGDPVRGWGPNLAKHVVVMAVGGRWRGTNGGY